MKFRINTTGSIVEPNDETVLEQMKNSPFYTAIPDVEPDAQEGDNEGVKPLSKMNKDELLAAAQAAGIQEVTKASRRTHRTKSTMTPLSLPRPTFLSFLATVYP